MCAITVWFRQSAGFQHAIWFRCTFCLWQLQAALLLKTGHPHLRPLCLFDLTLRQNMQSEQYYPTAGSRSIVNHVSFLHIIDRFFRRQRHVVLFACIAVLWGLQAEKNLTSHLTKQSCNIWRNTLMYSDVVCYEIRNKIWVLNETSLG